MAISTTIHSMGRSRGRTRDTDLPLPVLRKMAINTTPRARLPTGYRKHCPLPAGGDGGGRRPGRVGNTGERRMSIPLWGGGFREELTGTHLRKCRKSAIRVSPRGGRRGTYGHPPYEERVGGGRSETYGYEIVSPYLAGPGMDCHLTRRHEEPGNPAGGYSNSSSQRWCEALPATARCAGDPRRCAGSGAALGRRSGDPGAFARGMIPEHISPIRW